MAGGAHALPAPTFFCIRLKSVTSDIRQKARCAFLVSIEYLGTSANAPLKRAPVLFFWRMIFQKRGDGDRWFCFAKLVANGYIEILVEKMKLSRPQPTGLNLRSVVLQEIIDCIDATPSTGVGLLRCRLLAMYLLAQFRYSVENRQLRKKSVHVGGWMLSRIFRCVVIQARHASRDRIIGGGANCIAWWNARYQEPL